VAPLPRAERAVLDLQKIEDYCLDMEHPRERHKARVFRETLGIGRDDAAWLRRELFHAVTRIDAFEAVQDEFGTHWRVDVPLARQNRHVVIRTLWIVRAGEQVPRFVSCWVL
jgi:hypothetical protein